MNYLTQEAGVFQRRTALQESSGATDASKLVATVGTGKLDPSVIPGASVEWTPPIAPLMWHTLKGLSALGDGDSITTWPDQSGNGHDWKTDSQPTRKPLYQWSRASDTNPFLPLPHVRFDAAQFHQFNTALNPFYSLTEAELFCVLRVPGYVSDDKSGLWNFSAGDYVGAYPYSNNQIYDGTLSTVRKSCGLPSSIGVSITDWHILHIYSGPNLWFMRLNGTQLYQTTSNTFMPGVGNAINGQILGLQVWGSPFYFNGTMREFMVFPKALTESQRAKVLGHLEGVRDTGGIRAGTFGLRVTRTPVITVDSNGNITSVTERVNSSGTLGIGLILALT